MSFLGSAFAGLGNLAGGILQNNTAKNISNKQMDFQERMSNTAYQRSKADMEKAGINPMLAHSQGGASSPGGSSYQPENYIGSAVNSALATKRMYAEIANLKAQNEKIKADTILSLAELPVRQETARDLAYQNSWYRRATRDYGSTLLRSIIGGGRKGITGRQSYKSLSGQYNTNLNRRFDLLD